MLADRSPTESRIDALNTATQNLADDPTLANGPPQYLSGDDLHNTTQNLADDRTLTNGPPPQFQSRDALNTTIQTYQTKLLWTMDPPIKSRDDLHTNTQNMADELTLANGSPSLLGTREEMPWKPLYKLSRQTYFGQWTPLIQEQRWLAYHYPKLGRWPYIG